VGIVEELVEIWPNEVCDTLIEWSSLVSIVPISTGRSKEVLSASKALIERSLGSLLSHLGLWSGARTKRMGAVRLLVHCQSYWGPLQSIQ